MDCGSLNIAGDEFEIERIETFEKYPKFSYCVAQIAENVTLVTIPFDLGEVRAKTLADLEDTTYGTVVSGEYFYVPLGTNDSNYIDSIMNSL